jgi:hypothetical protein
MFCGELTPTLRTAKVGWDLSKGNLSSLELSNYPGLVGIIILVEFSVERKMNKSTA